MREDEQIAAQRSLLEARTRVRAGVDMGKAAEPLDALAVSGTEPWVREYAVAFRTLLAIKRTEKDWAKRYEALLAAAPRSRFLAEILVARAHQLAMAEKDPTKGIEFFRDAFVDAGKGGAPRRWQFRCFAEAAIQNRRNPMRETGKLRAFIWGWVASEFPNPDLIFSAASHSAEIDFRLLALGAMWRTAQGHGHDLGGFEKSIETHRKSAALVLPGPRASIEEELGLIALAQKRVDDARKLLQAAHKLDSDRARRYRIDAALARCKR